MDRSGRVRLAGDLAVAAVRSGRGVFDLEGRKMRAARMRMTDQTGEPLAEGFDAMLLLQLDLVGNRHNTLPVAVPRFLATEKDSGQRFGGPWTFEPVLLQKDAYTSPHAPPETSEAWVVPAETGNRLPYAITGAADAGDGSPVRHYDKLQSRFQPDLLKHASGFSWILRHGVRIDLDASGQVQAIREPRGASIRHMRQSSNLAGQEASDRQRVHIDWQDTQPTRLTLAGPAGPQKSSVV